MCLINVKTVVVNGQNYRLRSQTDLGLDSCSKTDSCQVGGGLGAG